MRRPQRIEPGPGQESVWDYPRPPRLERTHSLVRVEHAGVVVAETTAAWRVLETSQPPAFYLPPDDVAMEYLRANNMETWCEWKGTASYLDLVVGDVRGGEVVSQGAAWRYPSPARRFAPIAGHVAFYPQRVDGCFVDGERVRPQPGNFYGGWITSDVVGPFKGGVTTRGW